MRGLDVTLDLDLLYSNHSTIKHNTAVHPSSGDTQVQTVNLLLAANADPNATPISSHPDAESPLMHAKSGRCQVDERVTAAMEAVR